MRLSNSAHTCRTWRIHELILDVRLVLNVFGGGFLHRIARVAEGSA